MIWQQHMSLRWAEAFISAALVLLIMIVVFGYVMIRELLDEWISKRRQSRTSKS